MKKNNEYHQHNIRVLVRKMSYESPCYYIKKLHCIIKYYFCEAKLSRSDIHCTCFTMSFKFRLHRYDLYKKRKQYVTVKQLKQVCLTDMILTSHSYLVG